MRDAQWSSSKSPQPQLSQPSKQIGEPANCLANCVSSQNKTHPQVKVITFHRHQQQMFFSGSRERIKMINYKSCIRWRHAVALVALASATITSFARAEAEAEAEASKSQTNDKFKEMKMILPQTGSEQVQEAYYSDGWSPHSLEPTFTDQEQGDEMVALAAEPEPYVTRVLANNKTLQQVIPPARDSTMQAGKRYKEQGKRLPVQPDKYYSDEDAIDDESDNTRFGINDYGIASYPFERKDIKQQLQVSPTPSENHHSPDDFGINLNSGKSNSWLPKVNEQVTSTTGEQPEQQPERVSQQNLGQSSIPNVKDSFRAFGKTDAAIAYLRNMLNMKQSLQSSSNSTRPSPPIISGLPGSINYTRPNNKQENLQRLSLFASRLTQLLNNVTASQPSITPTQKTTTPSSISVIDTKFKIQDVKQQQIRTVASAIQPQPIANDFHNYEYDQPQIDTPNGTPVGGDYIESQDDFLRGSSSFIQNTPISSDAASLEPAYVSKDQLIPSETGQNYENYTPEPRKPNDPTYQIRPSQHAISSSYFRLAKPEPTAELHSANPSSRIPLNYQQQHSNMKQIIPYDMMENKKSLSYVTSNETEQLVSQDPSSKSNYAPLESTTRKSFHSKIYSYDKPPQPIRQHYHTKAPKIVSYNYFESPNDAGERDTVATNFKLGDGLYSSSGSLEHMLSNSELEAIQNQFVSSEHPVIGLNNHQEYASMAPVGDSHFASLLDSLKSDPLRTEGSDKKSLLVPTHNASAINDFSRDLADLKQKGVPQAVLPIQLDSTATIYTANKKHSKKNENEPKKNLIVYLNHPRSDDMSPPRSVKTEGEQYVAAKEFDSQGISKDNKYLDVADLNDYSELKSLQDKDKDGLSVVVIGDAYKYKKIVLLISSKAGGLKFIPMVKDHKK